MTERKNKQHTNQKVKKDKNKEKKAIYRKVTINKREKKMAKKTKKSYITDLKYE